MQASDGIAAVSFDVGGTLIDPWPSVGHVYAAVAAAHGHPGLSPETLNRQFAAAWQRRAPFDHSRTAWRWIVEETFAGFLDRPTAATLLDPLYRQFERAEAWRVYEDVVPTLRALRGRGLRLGVVSNWDERLRPLLRNLGLAEFFDVIAVSIEVGAAKPSPRIFHHCARALGVPPGAIVHVGDSPQDDVQGALAAGLQALHLQRQAIEAGPGCLTSLHELLEKLAPRIVSNPHQATSRPPQRSRDSRPPEPGRQTLGRPGSRHSGR